MNNVNSTIFLSIATLVYSLVIAVVFFTKKKVNSTENRVFKKQIIITLASLIIELYVLFITQTDNQILINLALKAFNCCILLWAFNFGKYTFFVSRDDKTIDYKVKYKILYMIYTISYFICVFIIFLLPIYLNNKPGYTYSYGPSVDFTYLSSGVLLLMMIIILIINIKKIKDKGYYPIISYVFLMIAVAIIQNRFPHVLLINFLFGFELMMLFNTIENPDMRLIEQLNIAKDQADKANKAKTDFLSNMSHEIRTPLNAIVGFSEILETENIPDSSRELVRDIMISSENLVEIVNGVLDISKIEADKLEIINTEYEFKKIFDEMVMLAKGRLGDKPLEFKYYYDPSIPNYLYGDSTRVKQIGVNLLTNAVKYTKEGSINFRINSVITDDVCRLIIIVEDTGIGIKKENIDKLFTKFERLGVERNTTVEGTGLGLAICKKLVELMGGKILVQSVYGQGSKFTVVLDQKIVKGKERQEEQQTVSNIIDIKDKKVLVIDDNELNIKVACRLLNGYNISTDSVISGIEALDKLKENKYDMILLDDMMPKMSGIETLDKMKETENFNTPVVVLTANAISGMREKYIGLGFDDYLSKPIEKLELNRVIRKYLS